MAHPYWPTHFVFNREDDLFAVLLPTMQKHNNIPYASSWQVADNLVDRLEGFWGLAAKGQVPPVIEFRCQDGYVIELGIVRKHPATAKYYLSVLYLP